MRWSKATRFALYAAVEMARADGEPVTAQQVAARYGMSANHLAKVMGQLVRAGLARGSRGVGGGYRLRRAPGAVTLLDVVEAIEGRRAPGCRVAGEDLPCRVAHGCELQRVFDGIEDEVVGALRARTLVDVLRSGAGFAGGGHDRDRAKRGPASPRERPKGATEGGGSPRPCAHHPRGAPACHARETHATLPVRLPVRATSRARAGRAPARP